MWIKPKIGRFASKVLPVDRVVEGVGVYTVVPGLDHKPFYYTFEYEVVQQEDPIKMPCELCGKTAIVGPEGICAECHAEFAEEG